MANPSHSTASPDPRNPQPDAGLDSRLRGNDGGGGNPKETSNSVRPELVEGPDGRPDPSTPPAASLRTGFDRLSPNGIPDPDTNTSRRIGFRIRALRKRRRLRQEDLAGLIDRSTEGISAIERGKAMPGYVTLARLAWALDVSPNVLFDMSEDADMSSVRAGLMTGIADRLRGLAAAGRAL